MTGLLAAFGLAAATGLNAYLPLLIVGALARYTDLITLKSPWSALTHPVVLAVLVVLLIIEITVDKIPAVDTINDVIQTFIRPAAGAVLFAASSNVISDMSPVLAMVCGLLVAGGVHAAKATVRPGVTATTAGLGNPVVSAVEDTVSGITTLVAIIIPALILVIFIVILYLFVRWRRKISKRN
ncbi:MAG: DUF4126 domain-containing protein [Candidatus Aminicenantes bacterium]|uniref:Putative transmembrane protein n=1 Tax=Candidatus Saccharicenans subterraneus TaxID=2508984 RepID=A0A3E2BKV5_9BACT|nr:DUF4126 domain-containing protein [Candidatus Aminicenantes bacterium]RFT15292.1 MAG: putative transmembrane protein [Candidatus Saccharicenans subterraneum]